MAALRYVGLQCLEQLATSTIFIRRTAVIDSVNRTRPSTLPSSYDDLLRQQRIAPEQRDDISPPMAVRSENRGGSTSVRGRVCSPHISGGRRWLSCRRPACSLGSCAMEQTDGRIALFQNAPLGRGHNKPNYGKFRDIATQQISLSSTSAQIESTSCVLSAPCGLGGGVE